MASETFGGGPLLGPDPPAIDCWHWLLCGWVVVPGVGTGAGPVTAGVRTEMRPGLQFPPDYYAGDAGMRDAD